MKVTLRRTGKTRTESYIPYGGGDWWNEDKGETNRTLYEYVSADGAIAAWYEYSHSPPAEKTHYYETPEERAAEAARKERIETARTAFVERHGFDPEPLVYDWWYTSGTALEYDELSAEEILSRVASIFPNEEVFKEALWHGIVPRVWT